MSHEQIKKMSSISLVFPHQLFENHPALDINRPVYIVEELLFFSQYNFHKQKLVFHRASMKAYQAYLQNKGYQVCYIEARENRSDVRNLLPALKQEGVSEIHHAGLTDNFLEKRIKHACKRLNIQIKKLESTLFI